MRINEKIQIYFLTNNVGVSSVTCTGKGFFVHFLSTCNRKRKHLSHQRERETHWYCLFNSSNERAFPSVCSQSSYTTIL